MSRVIRLAGMADKALLRAAGMLLLLSTLTACNNREKANGKVLVEVNGDAITARELDAEMWSVADKTGPAQRPAVRAQALEALIDRQVLLDEALRNKIDRDPKVIQMVDRLKTQTIVQAYLESKAANRTTVPKAEIDAYFHAHPELFDHRKVFDVTQLTVAAKDFGAPLKEMMDTAVSLGEVARWLREHRIDYVKTQRSYTSADLPPEMARKLQKLERRSLFVMQDTHRGEDELCVLTDLRDSPVTEEAAAAQIERLLLNKKMQNAAAAEIARLRASAKLVYADPAPSMMVEEAGGAPVTANISETR
jgi:peptidyl-prolyl cis-trans isomerase C